MPGGADSITYINNVKLGSNFREKKCNSNHVFINFPLW